MAGPFSFDPVEYLGATAVGEPGRRTFFLIIGDQDGWVRAWLEKEQLRALAEGLDELLARTGDGQQGHRGRPGAGNANPPNLPMVADFHIGQLAVGYDPDPDNVMLVVHDTESDDEDNPMLACRVTRQQAISLSAQATAVCDAGRPMCPLCDQPMDPSGHLCPRTNGHKQTGI